MADNRPSFAEALQLDGVLGALCDDELRGRLDRLSAIYDAGWRAPQPRRSTPSIPRVIHQIWLGSPLPQRLKQYSDSWRARHPDWEFRLWTDREVAAFDFGTRDLFEEAKCWGQKSDLLRAEIIDRFGGVYVDLDYECYEPLDDVVDRVDFFGTLKNIFTAYLGWPAIWRQPVVVCNSLFGARPSHPVLGAYLREVRSIWQRTRDYELREDELPRLAIAAMGGFAKAARIKDTGMRTFLPFGDIVTAHVGRGADRDVLFPPTFFNPVMPGALTLYLMPEFWGRCRAAGIRWPRLRRYTRRTDYTMANHLSHNSWV